ncbi:KLTH0G19756p [Lachancea thermotolerans CBS 6340]|uniref:KLTH0G19756p n=1 Tax=Lachancea thermotolerans (strain ATCC 56472 / CBS 6340 / NRRL Y-8284) TaxID=559295 RepID=C5DNT7_LACTC|nr:KLTH0G19756p [Lachancea thermotolerans CBS 6340]CAR25448.1 KLTH0G19756p [Lachancea thermotolerans CBS 6340]
MGLGLKIDRAQENKELVWTNVPASQLKLKNLKVAIVGGTSGIGQSLARLFQSREAEVVVVGRTFRDHDLANIQFIKADLELMSEAKRVAKKLAQYSLDVVIFTAGILAAPTREETVEGLERDVAVSYLSRLVIIRNLLPALEKANSKFLTRPRVFIFGFPCQGEMGTPDDLNSTGKYNGMKTHMSTVAGNETLVFDTARRYPGVGVYGLNPGLIKTTIRDNFLGAGSFKSWVIEGIIGFLFQSSENYASKIAPMMVATELDNQSPAFFDSNGTAVLSKGFTNSYIEKYISKSEELLNECAIPL